MPNPIPDHIRQDPRFAVMLADIRRRWSKRLAADPIGEAVRATQDERESEKAEGSLLQTWTEVAIILDLDEETVIERVRAEVDAMAGGLAPDEERRLRLDVDRAVELVRRERLFVDENEPDDEPAPGAGGNFPNAG